MNMATAVRQIACPMHKMALHDYVDAQARASLKAHLVSPVTAEITEVVAIGMPAMVQNGEVTLSPHLAYWQRDVGREIRMVSYRSLLSAVASRVALCVPDLLDNVDLRSHVMPHLIKMSRQQPSRKQWFQIHYTREGIFLMEEGVTMKELVLRGKLNQQDRAIRFLLNRPQSQHDRVRQLSEITAFLELMGNHMCGLDAQPVETRLIPGLF